MNASNEDNPKTLDLEKLRYHWPVLTQTKQKFENNLTEDDPNDHIFHKENIEEISSAALLYLCQTSKRRGIFICMSD